MILLGDSAIVMMVMSGNKILERHLAASTAEGQELLKAILRRYPNATNTLFLDTIDQNYSKQVLPSVSALNINKLVSRYLDKEYKKDDLKGALFLGREKTGRKDWNYLFMAVPKVDPFASWLNFLLEQRNALRRISLVPVEASIFAGKFNKVFHREVPHADWQLFVFHNRVSGFRQVVFHKGRMVFSRLVEQGIETVSEVIAGNIEQEVSNTLEYLRRLSLQDEDPIDIYACIGNEIKNHMSEDKIRGHGMHLFTPYELAEILGIKNGIEIEDRYSDIIFLASIAKHRPILALHSIESKKLLMLHRLLNSFKLITASALPIMLFYTLVQAMSFITLNKDLTFLEKNHTRVEKLWKVKEKETLGAMTAESQLITDMIALYQTLAGDKADSPFSLLSRLALINRDGIMIQSIDWKATSIPVEQQVNGIKRNIDLTFRLDFIITDRSVETLFNRFDTFMTALKKAVPEYTVESSSLPERISLYGDEKSVPVQITIHTKTEGS